MGRIFEGKPLPEGFRLGREEDFPLIRLTIAQAFADSKYPVPSNEISYSALLRMNYEIGGHMVANAIDKGVVLTNEDFSAVLVAVDLADACQLPLQEICDHLREYGTEENALRAEAIFRHIGEMEEVLPLGKDIIYIEVLAVQTPYQGQKRGSKLMRQLIAECADMGKDLLLFTNTERNVAIYRHLGFDILYDEFTENLNSYTAFMYCKTSTLAKSK